MSTVDKCLIAFAAVVMVAIYFIYPHTYLGQQSYAEQRQNAITYISAVQFETDKAYRDEVIRLIKKYHLEDIFSDNRTNPIEVLLND